MRHTSTLYVGLDVHKDSITVAYVDREPDAEAVNCEAVLADIAQMLQAAVIARPHTVDGCEKVGQAVQDGDHHEVCDSR